MKLASLTELVEAHGCSLEIVDSRDAGIYECLIECPAGKSFNDDFHEAVTSREVFTASDRAQARADAATDIRELAPFIGACEIEECEWCEDRAAAC